MFIDLLEKYNVAVPRYTSYPTVPMWDTESTNGTRWLQHVRASFNRNKEISLYIHLPYCESLCTYCGCNKHITKNHLVEKPYIGAVLKEWSLYVQALGELPIIKEIHLGGGTPTFFSPENLELLVKGLKKLSQASENCDMSFEAHPSSTSYEHLAQLRKIGFNRLSVGVQDFDENILRTIHRFQTIKQVRDVVNQARELGYKSVNFDLIYGLPGQTLEHITANMKEVESLKPDRIAFYSYAHVPTVKPGQRAYSEADLPKGREKLLLYQRGKAMLLKMGYADIGMDHFALERDAIFKSMKRKSLHRNFMGYTPYHTELSIGLGASAISDSWTAYAQNEKSVKGYLQQIRESAELPIIKNHFLTEEDQRIRLHILNLICHFETDWLGESNPELFENNPELVQLEKDGLIRRFPYQIKVTELGKSFIRNICKALDLRMKSSSKEAVFSKAV